ncbi:MAG: Crp/Fnr family transcriptional regulator [Candidatus Sulfotelmatobacter sp.]
MIIQSGDVACHLFFLSKGNVKYYRVTDRGEERILGWLAPGDVFGLATLLKNPPGYIGSAVAEKDSTLWAWEHSSLCSLCTVYPQLSQNALRITIDCLAAYVDRHTALTTKSAEERLGHTLLRLGRRAGRTHPEGIDIDITNEQVGGLADIGVFTASRLLSKWERQGTISKGRGNIRIHAPERLLFE